MATTFLKVKNDAFSKLASGITDVATSLIVTTSEGSLFPSTFPFHITIESEIIEVGARSGDVLSSLVRAQQSTSAAAHASGITVTLNITAQHITDLNDAVNFIEKYADYGLAFFGAVTTYTDTTHFKVSSLAGLGASTFLPASGTPYEIYVFKADGAAPQGEQTPVVAYTTGDGTFQHAAFTSPLAFDDEVLIIHPLLASLGTKATAAASGAVTSTDYMMAYVKQIVTELIVVDTVVDGIQTDLSNATDGLGALKALIDAIQTDVGDPTGETLASLSAKIGDIARSIDVIIGARWDSSGDLGTDIAQLLTYTDILDDATNGLANIKTLIDTAQTDITAILLDTGTTIPATITTLQTAVDAIQTDLDNATDGLGALKTLIDAIHSDLGDVADTATADDLSDITTTSALAKLRRLLLRFSSGAFSVSLDGSARTDLDALYTALGVLLGTRNATVSAGVLADTESAMALLRRIATAMPLVLFGDITGYTDTENFVVADFIGWENDFFKGWSGYLVRDDGGASAIPQGARVEIKDYVSTTGALVTSPLSAAGAVGDQFMLIHPILMDAWNARGGVENLASIIEELAAMGDMAEVRSIASPVTLTGSFQYIYTNAPARPFFFHGGFISRASGGWANSEAVTVNVEVKIDGSNWVEIWTVSYAAEPSPVLAAIPSHDPDNVLLNIPLGFPNKGDGVRVGIKQTVQGDGYHTYNHSFIDEVAGS